MRNVKPGALSVPRIVHGSPGNPGTVRRGQHCCWGAAHIFLTGSVAPSVPSIIHSGLVTLPLQNHRRRPSRPLSEWCSWHLIITCPLSRKTTRIMFRSHPPSIAGSSAAIRLVHCRSPRPLSERCSWHLITIYLLE